VLIELLKVDRSRFQTVLFWFSQLNTHQVSSWLYYVTSCVTHSVRPLKNIRSQAVAKTADRTASQHLWGSRDVIGHETTWYPRCMPFPIGGPLEPSLYL